MVNLPHFVKSKLHLIFLDDPECQFIQNSNVLDYGDHRSQMMAFCGHDLVCAAFNSEEVLQRAKANVDKFYPVVGVLENLNQTLAVMENKLPHVFKGATKVNTFSTFGTFSQNWAQCLNIEHTFSTFRQTFSSFSTLSQHLARFLILY